MFCAFTWGSSLLLNVHLHALETEVAHASQGQLLFGLLQRLLFLLVVLLGQVFLLETRQLVLLFLALPEVLLGWVIPDELVAVVLPPLELEVLVALLVHIIVVEIVVVLFVVEAVVIVFDFYLDLISQDQVVVQIVERIEVVLFDELSLGLNYLFHVLDHPLLNLKVDLKFNVL